MIESQYGLSNHGYVGTANMKSKRQLIVGLCGGLAAFLLFASMLTGCAIFGGEGATPEQKIARYAAIARLAAATGCLADISSRPETRDEWRLAQGCASALCASEKLDASDVARILTEHGLTEKLAGSEGALIIMSGITIVDTFFSDSYDLDKEPAVRAVVCAISNGIGQALGPAATVKKTGAGRATGLVRDTEASQQVDLLKKLEAEAKATRVR